MGLGQNASVETPLSAHLIFGLLRATERAALAAKEQIGRGDEFSADKVAVEAMRQALNEIEMEGRIVIGEGERDEAPMLFIGEKVGTGTSASIAVDIAVDPLEGTTLTAKGQANALAVAALAHRDCLLHAPDVYMEKIAIGGGFEPNLISLEASAADNVRALAKAKGVKPSEIKVCVLDRPRHAELVEQLRSVGAVVCYISDGDIAGVIHTTDPNGVDMYVGVGGAPEGVLAATALHSIGGQMVTRLVLDTEEKLNRARKMGIKDPNHIYSIDEMVRGDAIFVATGVTDGSLLKGARNGQAQTYTHSLLIHAANKERRFIENFQRI